MDIRTEQKIVESQGLKFYCRTGTTDEKVIPEVVGRKEYFKRGFLEPSAGEIWADLGGNIGTFSILVASLGCQAIAFEPEPSNAEIFRANVALNEFQKNIQVNELAVTVHGGGQILFMSKGKNKYRHTIARPIKGRPTIMIGSIPFASVLALGVDAVKMDIEGSELEIFDSLPDWGKVKKLAFEYHFDFDRSIPRFYERIEKLRKHFDEIKYSKMPDGESYDFFPAAKTVYCVRYRD
jgi:FkbM family methyltransferase